MDEKLSEENGQTVPTHQEEEEEMEVTVTTQLESVTVTPDNADLSSHTETQPEEKGAVHTDSTAAALSLDSVCKTEDCDDDDEDDDSEDSDRYLHTCTQQFHKRLVINVFSLGTRKELNK